MFRYYLNRGLDAVEVLARTFSARKWLLPDLICDDVLETISKHAKNIDFYHIDENLNWSVKFKFDSSEAKIFYVIDFFGAEVDHGRGGPPNTIVIRDSVWFPYPFSPVETNHIWFNSLRKIFHAERGIKGSNIISPYRILGLQEQPNLYYHPSLTWHEMNKRFENYYFCKEIFSKYAIPGHNQQFPSVFPIRLKNREHVLGSLDVKLPGMWKNKYKLPNKLYEELAFVPLDSRYDCVKLAALADKIKELANAVGDD